MSSQNPFQRPCQQTHSMNMGSCSTLRHEFQLSKFGFSGVKAERFCISQWRMPVTVYIIYRLLLMTYVALWMGYTRADDGSGDWGIYLTNWTYVMLTIYVIAHFLAVVVYHTLALFRQEDGGKIADCCCRRPEADDHALMFVEIGSCLQDSGGYESLPGCETSSESVGVSTAPRPPWYLCAVWVLFNVISTAALMVTIVFFAFLFPEQEDASLDLDNLQLHLMNSVVIVIEHLITAAPWHLLHVIYPFIYAVIYMLFSVIHWSGDHSRVIYSILDWNKPGPTVGYVLLIGFVIIPLLHTFFFLVQKAKMAVFRRL